MITVEYYLCEDDGGWHFHRSLSKSVLNGDARRRPNGNCNFQSQKGPRLTLNVNFVPVARLTLSLSSLRTALQSHWFAPAASYSRGSMFIAYWPRELL